MSRSLPFILGLVAAGAVGALAATLLAPPADSSNGAAEEIRSLRLELGELSSRVASVEDRAREASRMPPALAEAPRPAILDEPLPEAGPSAAAPTDVPPEVFEERVREVVQESRAKEMAAIGDRFRQMAKERQTRMLDDLTDKHGLTSYQRGALDEILTRRQSAISEFFQNMFGGGEDQPDMSEIRTKLQEVSAATDEEIQALLAPDQYEAFKEQDQMSRRGGFMMGGGGGPGRGR